MIVLMLSVFLLENAKIGYFIGYNELLLTFVVLNLSYTDLIMNVYEEIHL